MAPTLTASAKGYFNLFNAAVIRSNYVASAATQAKIALSNRGRFQRVARATGVPWQWIAAIANRESGMSFAGAFANGDPIIGTGRKTTHVPAGRGPFDTWEESAIDEIKRKGLDKITNWSVERMSYQAEAYNGWGYLNKCNSPYVWSWTTQYGPPEEKGGKYIADGKWSATTIDKQEGCVAFWKALADIDPDTAILLKNREVKAPAEAIETEKKKITKKERAATGAGSAGTVAGAGNEGSIQLDKPEIAVLPSWAGQALFLVGAAIVITAIILTIRKGNLLKQRW